MASRDVCLEDLRFTQDSIAIKFKCPDHHLRIDHAIDQIRKRELSPIVFSPLNVVHQKNILWSLDNRRLWVLRKVGVATVEINLVPPTFIKRSSEFFSSLDPLLENQYSSPLYFPVVQGQVRFVFTPPPPHVPVPVTIPTVELNSRKGTTIMVAEQSSNVGPPPPLPLPKLPQTAVAGRGKKVVPHPKSTTPLPVPTPASLVSPLPNISQEPTKKKLSLWWEGRSEFL